MSEVIGKIYRKDETKTFGEKGFRKREFIIVTADEYPQHILLELIQDKCDILDSYKVGDDVKVSVNLNGRLWTNPEGVEKCFNAIQGWRIEKVTEETAQNVDPKPLGEQDDNNSLPF